MSSYALELELKGVKGETAQKIDLVGGSRVESQRKVQLIESSASRHKALACENLLGGTAVEHNRTGFAALFQLGFETYCGAYMGHTQKIVAAALTGLTCAYGFLMGADLLAHAGKGVELAQKAHYGMSAAPCGLYGSRHTRDISLHLKALLFHVIGHPVRGLSLLESHLRLVPHVEAYLI